MKPNERTTGESYVPNAIVYFRLTIFVYNILYTKIFLCTTYYIQNIVEVGVNPSNTQNRIKTFSTTNKTYKYIDKDVKI